MTVKYFVPPAVTGLLLSALVGVAPLAAQQPASPLAADSSFIQEVSSLGLLQEKLAKVAQDKGSSAAVQEFARQMATEYSKTNKQLADAAKQAAFPRPVLLRQHAQLVDRFQRMSRSSFEKAYMTQTVESQTQAVRLFQQEARNGRVASLKQLASDILPAVQQQLKVARETAGTVGADVTASSSEAYSGS
jgi:putative membrane protein